jgi:predicted transcriptional regulator YdeE
VEHTIVSSPAVTVIGLGVDCPNYDGSGIGECWMRFNSRQGELPAGGRALGVSLPRENGFYYVAGHEVPAGTPVPEGMETAEIPAADYFCYQFHDRPEQMPAAFGRIFHEGLSSAGVKAAAGPVCWEHYPPDWHDEAAGKFRCELLVQLAA